MAQKTVLQALIRGGAWLALAFPALLYASAQTQPSFASLVPILLALAVPLVFTALNKFIRLGMAALLTVFLVAAGSQLPSAVVVLGFVLAEIAASSRTRVIIWSFLFSVGVIIPTTISTTEIDPLRPLWLVHTISIGLFLVVGIVVKERRALIEQTSKRLEIADHAHQIELEQVVAQERLKISRDLHNRIGHQLSVISLSTEAVKQHSNSVDQVQASLDLIGRAAREGLEEISSYLNTLRESEPDKPEETLRTKFERFGSLGLSVSSNETQLPPTRSSEKLKFVSETLEELLMNAYKYGDGVVEYQQSLESGLLTISMTNTCTSKEGPSGGGYGLTDIAERATEIGASFTYRKISDSKFEALLKVSDWS